MTAEGAPSFTVPAQFHGDQTLTACGSPPALSTHDSGMRDGLRAHRAGEPNVVRKDCPGWNQHPVRWWRCPGQWSPARSRGRTPPLAFYPRFPCSTACPNGSRGIPVRLGRLLRWRVGGLLWRSLRHQLVLRTCYCCWGRWRRRSLRHHLILSCLGRWRRRRSGGHPWLTIRPGKGGQLRGRHLHPSVFNSLLGVDHHSVPHPGDDGERMIQLFGHVPDPRYHTGFQITE
jgi:hypothetical protein